MPLFPYATDAPVYHWPFATVGLIVTNALVFTIQATTPGFTEEFMLIHGELDPVQWVTSGFLHADLLHLLGNMLFLWIFGLIVEGKVGWLRTLGIFLMVLILQCALEQFASLFYTNGLRYSVDQPAGSLGASAGIFGLIVIAMLWAPENEIHFKWIFCYHVVSDFSVSVLMVGFCYIALDFLVLWFSHFAMGSAMFHLMGGVLGGVVGYVMLKQEWVDCEGYDQLSIWRGEQGNKPLSKHEELELKEQYRQASEQNRKDMEAGLANVQRYADAGHYDMAIKRFQLLRKHHLRMEMPEPLLIQIIEGLIQTPHGQERAIPWMERYIEKYTDCRIPVALNLAKIYLKRKQRPRRAMILAHQMAQHPLSAAEKRFCQQLITRAQQMIVEGVVERESH